MIACCGVATENTPLQLEAGVNTVRHKALRHIMGVTTLALLFVATLAAVPEKGSRPLAQAQISTAASPEGIPGYGSRGDRRCSILTVSSDNIREQARGDGGVAGAAPWPVGSLLVRHNP